MIPKECKRLAEVDFPIAAVSIHAAKEKSIRHGHPSTLHLWWARRPLAACRAVLLAMLLPDPGDPACPEDFKAEARRILRPLPGEVGDDDEGLRRGLLGFVGAFADWNRSGDAAFLEAGRALIRAAQGEEAPLVVDPFSGGGSIPLEALRLGCDAFASDLNPVACQILKTMLEDIPKRGPGLGDELRAAGAKVQAEAKAKLEGFYPADADGAAPIAYIWARTVACDHCGAEVPLVRSLWLSKKAKRKRALRWHIEREGKKTPRIEFEVFEPKREEDVQGGTVARAKASCPACNRVTPAERVRAQLREQRGGADAIFDERGQRTGGARMLAVVLLRPGETGRQYRVARAADYEPVRRARLALAEMEKAHSGPLSLVPDEALPPQGTLGFRVQLYGMTRWGDLFTARQKLALASYFAPQDILAICTSRFSNAQSSISRWDTSGEKIQGISARPALPLVWDFCECAPISPATGSFQGAVEWVANVAEMTPVCRTGSAQRADACASPLPTGAADVWFTDPPYYDAIPYADLSDFFYVWLRRCLPGFGEGALTPKDAEIVQDEVRVVEGRPKDKAFFEERMAVAFAEGRRVLDENGIGCVVFAHKTTEGWEALLSGMIRSGWVITASWPIATELTNRIRAQQSAALATSVHLVCRPRGAEAGVGDWGDVYRELPRRIGDWMERLGGEGVRGADLVFACIGPAMEVYSRYERVEDAEGRTIPLGGDAAAAAPHERGFLSYVWETVGRQALEQILGTAEAKARNGAAGALEEDARLTALFLWTVEAGEAASDAAEEEEDEGGDEEDAPTKAGKKRGLSLVYDVVRRFAQPLGIRLEQWEGRVIAVEKGVVRLLPVAERARQLLGEDVGSAARHIEAAKAMDPQLTLAFVQEQAAVPQIGEARGRGRGRTKSAATAAAVQPARAATTLDRVHAAMLLLASGQTNALRALARAEQERGPEFLRLANALSALYPKASEEKRLLDAVLLAMPR